MKYSIPCLVVVILFLFVDTALAAPTYFEGVISEDTVWSASTSPYILSDKVTVSEGVTLTLEPGTVVKLWQKGIVINGTLIVEGDENNPVHFTSHRDDNAGGDTNSDGSNTAPASGDWQGIQFGAGAVGLFDYADIRYTGYSYRSSVPAISTVHNIGGDVTVKNSKFSFSKICGLGQLSGATSVSHSQMEHMACGAGVTGGVLQFTDISINNSDIGVYSSGAEVLELANVNFQDVRQAADINLENLDFIHNGNIASGGELNGLLIRGVINEEVILTRDSMPYIITSIGGSGGVGGLPFRRENNLTINTAGSLIFESGVVLKFHDSGALHVQGVLVGRGEPDFPVHLTSIRDDSVGGDTNGDADTTAPAPGDWLHVRFEPGSVGNLNNTVVRYGGHDYPGYVKGDSLSNIFNTGGAVNISASEIAYGHTYGLRNDNGTATISQSRIHDNGTYGVFNSAVDPTDARNNYWGDPSGPYHESLNPSGLGDRVSSNILFKPWKGAFCTKNCYSSVLFLPGIQASRLYLGDGTEVSNRLWEPSNNDDVRALALSEQGTSIIDIRTEDVIAEAAVPVIGANIYKGFIDFMDGLVGDQTIKDWTPFAYDWRYDVFDIVEDGTKYRDGSIRNPVDELITLSEESLSGKVTIIGHSNGGLLAKAIMIELKQRGKADLVDKIVFIGTPQLGTPMAIGTLLHGYDQEKMGGLIIDDGVARDVIRNLPGGYGLLPSEAYLELTNEPVVHFDDSQTTAALRDAYGTTISDISELTEFLNGVEDTAGRESVTLDEVNKPIKANADMLSKALQNHKDKLDGWSPPDGVEVFQIAGTGLPTVKAIEYREIVETVCPEDANWFNWFTECEEINILKPHVLFTAYGDKTVVSDSGSHQLDNVSNLMFLNLKKIEDERIPVFGTKLEHSNLTENQQLQEQIEFILSEDEMEGNNYFVSNEPFFTDNFDIEEINSPVQIHAKDTEGNITGMVYENGNLIKKEEIPGSSYFELGGTKYLIIPSETERSTTLNGEELGGYTLSISTLEGSVNQLVHQVVNATTTAEMVSTFSKNNGEYSSIKTDLDGDGEYELESTIDGEPIIEVPEYSYQSLIDYIKALKLKKAQKKLLLTTAKSAEKLNEKAKRKALFSILEKLTLKIFENLVDLYQHKRLITDAEAKVLINTVRNLD